MVVQTGHPRQSKMPSDLPSSSRAAETDGEPAILEDDLVALPPGKNYELCDENDRPTGEVLEEEQLVGVDDPCPVADGQPLAAA